VGHLTHKIQHNPKDNIVMADPQPRRHLGARASFAARPWPHLRRETIRLQSKEAAATPEAESSEALTIISYEEPGIQAIATTTPDLPTQPGAHALRAVMNCGHEFKRRGR
jgi:hypothetical protein